MTNDLQPGAAALDLDPQETVEWRTTLGAEGLQHQNGASHLVVATLPNCKAYDPASLPPGVAPDVLRGCYQFNSYSPNEDGCQSPKTPKTPKTPPSVTLLGLAWLFWGGCGEYWQGGSSAVVTGKIGV